MASRTLPHDRSPALWVQANENENEKLTDVAVMDSLILR